MLNFMLNQELHFREREHQFIEDILELNLGRPFCLISVDGSDEATLCLRSGPQSRQCGLLFLLDFFSLIFIEASTSRHVSCHH